MSNNDNANIYNNVFEIKMKYYGLIDYKYCFSTLKEYKNKKNIIKKAYCKWNKTQIALYRMYVYSRPFISDNSKAMIWEELNLYRNMEVEDEI